MLQDYRYTRLGLLRRPHHRCRRCQNGLNDKRQKQGRDHARDGKGKGIVGRWLEAARKGKRKKIDWARVGRNYRGRLSIAKVNGVLGQDEIGALKRDQRGKEQDKHKKQRQSPTLGRVGMEWGRRGLQVSGCTAEAEGERTGNRTSRALGMGPLRKREIGASRLNSKELGQGDAKGTRRGPDGSEKERTQIG